MPRRAAKRLIFRNPLPIPPAIDMTAGGHLDMPINAFWRYVGVDGEHGPLPTRLFGYMGNSPGPTIVARKDVPITVRWMNELHEAGAPIEHFLPIDTSICWANPPGGGVPIVTHVHGAHVAADSDGNPQAWFTPGAADTGPLYNPVYTYVNDQEAATLWYHDHAMGITRLNVYAGMAGFYLLRDDNEQHLIDNNLIPSGAYEIGLAIQDRTYNEDGSLHRPSEPEMPGQPSPSIQPEFFGDTMIVNGMIWPYLEVQPRPYRFRFLNGCDSRFLVMSLTNGQSFVQIGTDLGLLESPVAMDQLVMGPGERADIVLDFSAYAGRTIVLKNSGKSPFPMGSVVDPRTTGQIMQFRVSNEAGSAPKPVLPQNLRPLSGPIPTPPAPVRTRKLLLFEGLDEYGRLKPMLGTAEDGAMEFMDPPTETPYVGDTEIWEIYNATMDAHPIHLHLVAYQILNRQKFTATHDHENGALSNIRLIGRPRPPAANERGLKDTTVMLPHEVTRIIATFDRAGEYVWHCHILSHEDHDMMRPYEVIP